MIGRKKETKQLKELLKLKRSSFLAVTGRRRIGKTYIIDTVFRDNIQLRVTGIQDAPLQEQIINFTNKIVEYSGKPVITQPSNWQEVFLYLKNYLKTLKKNKKCVIFLDELPWISTQRSGFLKHLAHLWNDYLSKEKHFILVVCGSSSSWLTQKIINDKGGLHNRLTNRINLKSFTLRETQDFFLHKNIHLTPVEVSKLYMTFGGVPYYLEQIQKGENSTTAIERICFSNEGTLKNEYDNLYKALFKNATHHEAIVAALANKNMGLYREEVIDQSGVAAGGTYDRTMSDLLTCGFVTELLPYGKKSRGKRYRLNDEFSIFYHKFMKANKQYTQGMWQQMVSSQAYKIWTGFAFENLCLKHIDRLKDALGVSAVYTEISCFRITGNPEQDGVQIDLVMERKDDVIHLFEMKFYAAPFTINKSYANILRLRKQLFIETTGTKKQVFNTFVTNFGLVENAYALELVDAEIELELLF